MTDLLSTQIRLFPRFSWLESMPTSANICKKISNDFRLWRAHKNQLKAARFPRGSFLLPWRWPLPTKSSTQKFAIPCKRKQSTEISSGIACPMAVLEHVGHSQCRQVVSELACKSVPVRRPNCESTLDHVDRSIKLYCGGYFAFARVILQRLTSCQN